MICVVGAIHFPFLANFVKIIVDRIDSFMKKNTSIRPIINKKYRLSLNSMNIIVVAIIRRIDVKFEHV